MSVQPTLKRSLSLPLLTLYGVGTTVGAGIYALTGTVAGVAGYHAPLAFVAAALLAGLTALSFAELATRLPLSAGEALYVRVGFGSAWLSLAVGLLVVLAGTVSSAAIVNAFVGYFREFADVPRIGAILVVVVLLGAVATWGILESVVLIGLVTVIEVGGVLAIIVAGAGSLADLPARLPDFAPPLELAAWHGIFVGGLLAFYAFIGFEDMVNVVEEVKDAERTMPRAIIWTLAITTLLYAALAVVAVLSVPPAELGASEAPLALVFERTTGLSGLTISAISIIAILNGALVQIVMASRVLYGLSAQGMLPKALGTIHVRTRTPVRATLLVTVMVALFALAGHLAGLAQATSIITLTIFSLVNLALCLIKRREPAAPRAFILPGWVPALGFLASTAVLLIEAARRLGFWDQLVVRI